MEVGYFRSSQEDFHRGHCLNVPGAMDPPEFSLLSSLRGEFKPEDYIQPHYKESYRLAIDQLVQDGRDSYQEFLKGERIGNFLSEDELQFITANAKKLSPQKHTEEADGSPDSQSSSGTYWPLHSDHEAPNLDMGWPEVFHQQLQTNVDLLFHPPRLNNPTIKEVIRKHIQDARKVIAIVMDVFTDVDIFKETVEASIRGVPVYILLDDFHLQSFLEMAENQDVKLQQLRNVRVRTVKGQDYLCRSGAKFHGALEQRFLLVDCHTAVYGSYSFTWSFEKIHLSMVQVITGHLVKSYDEEFRTLYARSTVPDELNPPEGLFQGNSLQGQQILPKSHSAPKFGRTDQLRQSLDTVYRRACERKTGMRDLENRLLEGENNKLQPLVMNDITVRGQISRFQQFETADAMSYLKRHSYAGERQEGQIPQNIQPRASNWNISRDTGSGQINYGTDNYLHVPQIYRGQNMRQTYNGNDKQVLSMQQNMTTLENTSSSFMRTLRIESYLKDPDPPFDSCDYSEQFEALDKGSSFMQGRIRTSLALRSTIPGQMEPHNHIDNTSGAPNTHYSSMQWNPTVAVENSMNTTDFMMKKQSLIMDDLKDNTGYNPGKNSYHSTYASLGRSKRGQIIPNPDILMDTWQKRHSVADPRSNTEDTNESSGHMYRAFQRPIVNINTTGIPAQNGAYGKNLNDQRSVSHYDVKSITDTKGPSTPSWQQPPCRTVSAAVLDLESKDVADKSNSMDSQHFLKKSSNKIKSLLNIPEKKDDSIGSMKTPSVSSAGSSDTITAEDDNKRDNVEQKRQQTGTNFVRSSSERQRSTAEHDRLRSSKPRFTTEELHRLPPQRSLHKASSEKKPSNLDKGSRPGAESRLYSRYEPFCSLERKQPLPTDSGHTQSQDKTRSLSKGEATVENNLSRGNTRGHHENKLEKFFQRVGNFIHKNK
ncbi:protein FAM83B [Cololabis saira]|uniref:protein FAM83B n=1 Tax=Cololabis saira TaxID=129043 RepID=UPI002AD34906|nr:protein FAM83B [Cololabis saira]